ncbi:MAG: transcription antitermination factor NusB [Clostridia bacterium]|nr:transcription antitermination factor NusB [Clostridia bacterium]
MDRTQARAAAMQLVYEKEMGGDGGIDTRIGLLEIAEEDKNTKYVDELVEAVEKNLTAIDEKISSFLRSGWRLERITRVDLCILRVGVAEMLYCGTPAAVVINEAIELSRKYSTEEIGSFINGVLGSVARSMQAEKA